MGAEFKTQHNLPFESQPWPLNCLANGDWNEFRIGTCHGLWRAAPSTYDILAINNNEPGNGHFEDVLEWFENSCKRDKKDLRILEIWNSDFGKHLVEKRGFVREGKFGAIKKF